MKLPRHTIFFHLETTVKSYRQFAQHRIDEAGIDLTIDQWLLLNAIVEDEAVSHTDLVINLGKDRASVTRILHLTVKKGYLNKEIKSDDRRRQKLIISEKGKEIMEQMKPVVTSYRRDALEALTKNEIESVLSILHGIRMNISKYERHL